MTALTRKARRWWLTTPRKEASRYYWSTMPNEQLKYTERMKVFEVVDRKEASGRKVIRT